MSSNHRVKPKMTLSSHPLIAGDVVLRCRPLVHVIGNEDKGKHCDSCIKPLEVLKKCSKCLQMFYCDQKCQKNDWIYHKNECKVFANINYTLEATKWKERLILRLWLSVESDPFLANKRFVAIDGSNVCLNDIDIKNRSAKELEYFEYICRQFRTYGLFVDRRRLLRWFTLISTDNRYVYGFLHYVHNPLEFNISITPVAYGLHIQLKPLRHSCHPNSALVNNGLSLVLRVMSDVAVGEEITIAYIGLDKGYGERQEELFREYGFRCRCAKCVKKMDINYNYDWLRSLLMTEGIHWHALKVGDPMFQVVRRMNKEYEINSYLISHLRQIYGHYHRLVSAILVVSFMTFVLYSTKANRLTVQPWYAEVEKNLLITHGSDHPFYEMFMKFVQSIRFERNEITNRKEI